MPAASIIPFLCLRQLLLSPGYINEASLSVVGRIGYRLPVTLLNVAVSLAVILVVARFGLRELAIAQCWTAVLALATCIGLQSKIANVDWLEIAKGVALLIAPSSFLMVAAVMLVQQGFSGSLPWREAVVLQIVTGTLTYAGILLILLGLNRRLHWLALE